MATTAKKHASRMPDWSPFDLLPIAQWGRVDALVLGGGFAALTLAAGLLSPWLAIAPGALGLFVIWFFRDPPRRIPGAAGMIVSPADGLVTDVEEVVDADCFYGPALKISIYLSIFDVHVNRVPEAARVVEVRLLRGRRLNTWRAESAEVNEQCCTLFEGEGPARPCFLVRQVAGPFASRVVCAIQPGQALERGERFGMIKFGSRTELLIARLAGLRAVVQPGDRVKGGSSVVARYDV
jgi:phosphatidylserine decarboxylase